ncbi:MAG: urease accessory protein UreE [Burkholderiaceae bacterium]
MLTFHTKVDHVHHVDSELVLSFELREKSRLQAKLESGEDVSIMTGDGVILRNGDLLKGDDGRVLRILAAKESTYRVECDTHCELLRCAFHLGSKRVQVHIGSIGEYCYLRIRPDPALKDMLEKLGATVIDEHAAFEPEPCDPCMEGHADDWHPH